MFFYTLNDWCLLWHLLKEYTWWLLKFICNTLILCLLKSYFIKLLFKKIISKFKHILLFMVITIRFQRLFKLIIIKNQFWLRNNVFCYNARNSWFKILWVFAIWWSKDVFKISWLCVFLYFTFYLFVGIHGFQIFRYPA